MSYYTRKQFTQQDLDNEKARSRELASNEQTHLEREALHIKQLATEIEDLENQLHATKMRHQAARTDYTKSLLRLTRNLDSLR